MQSPRASFRSSSARVRQVVVTPVVSALVLVLVLMLAVRSPLARAETVVATIPVGSSPAGIAVNPTTNRIYVTNVGDDTVTVVDGTTNTVITTIAVGDGPNGVGVNPTTNRIYVANAGDDTVSVIDGTTNTVIETIAVGNDPVAIGVNPTTNRIYVSELTTTSTMAWVLDGDTNTVIGTIPGGSTYLGVAVNPTTNRIYVANFGDDTVTVVDGTSDTVIDTIAVGNGPTAVGVNPTTNRIYVTPAFDEVWVVDGTTNTVVDTITVGNGPAGVGVNPNTNRIYVANNFSNTVTVVDGTTNTVIDTIAVGNGPTGIGVNPTTHRIYVANTFSNSVSVIDGSPPTPTPTGTPTETPTPTLTSTPVPASTSTPTPSPTPTSPPPSSAPPPAPTRNDWAPRIAIVWPHGSASTSPIDVPLVNVSVWPSVAVSCQLDPSPPVELFVARNHEPAVRVDNAPRRIERSVGEVQFPSLEFDAVPSSLATDPQGRDTFFSVVEGQPTGNVWVHAADPRTILPQPLVPTGQSVEAPGAVDVRIQVVWPHDGAGALAPVERATQVNVAIELFAHGTTLAVPPEAEYPVQLWWARGNDPLALAPFAVEKVTSEVDGQVYARWEVNNVPVEPGEVYHFVATAGRLGEGGTSSATVWTHAADGRTYYPHPQVPPSCAS